MACLVGSVKDYQGHECIVMLYHKKWRRKKKDYIKNKQRGKIVDALCKKKFREFGMELDGWE